MKLYFRGTKLSTAILSPALIIGACMSDSPSTTPPSAVSPAATPPAVASSDSVATTDNQAAASSGKEAVAALSCRADVVYDELPPDLQHPQVTRYTELVMGRQTVMRFAVGSEVSDAQVERAVRLARFYLQDVPGSKYGADKSPVRDALAANNATMIMPNGAHQEGHDIGLPGQELYAAEIAAEGSSWYIENDFDHRDAAMEEIFHQVHDAGIGTDRPGALPDYQAQLVARAEATAGTVWGIGEDRWLSELRAEGSLAQEYIAAVIDSWYGLWGPWQGEGGMGDLYIAKTRGDVETKDPEGAALLRAFLPDVLEYEAYIDSSFSGTFSLALDEAQPYTHKSQYLRGARLTGTNDASIVGNDLDNTLRGNAGDNTLDGGAGADTAIYCGTESQYRISSDGGVATVTGPDGTDTLINIETIVFLDGSTDHSAITLRSPDSFEDAEDFFSFAAKQGGYADSTAFETFFFGLDEAEANKYVEELLQISPQERADFVERMADGENIDPEELATFSVEGSTAVMSGTIGTATPDAVRTLLAEHPEVARIVMTDVPGSVDDVANLEAGRLIREAGLATHANSDSFLASGGVDFYLAGATRTFDEGAQFGVHSWGGTVEGSEIPRDDPQHQLYLDYYASIGIDSDFYWFTLQAAPATGIHWMTESELARYGFAS